VADWKIFYFLRSLQRNLLHNPCAEGGCGEYASTGPMLY
jgi:hypothetical protein